ncbi:hypothetical protein G9A89_021493 [Geosiphon pyriformis]|nr:hypothetical protein G9A89_021493 [Geosiphon pyriformis]
MSNSWERVDVYYNELAIPLISPAVQIIGDNLKINSVTGGSTTSRKREFTANKHQQHLRKETKNLRKNKFKVVTTPDATTLEYYQSIYTHLQSQYTIDFELETETSNKGKNKLKQYSRTTPNTLTLPKTTAKHLQTPKQGTSSKLPLTITPFPASLAQAQTPNSPLNRFARPEDFTSLRSSTKQQEPLQTSSNLLDFLAENQSEHSKTAANEENNSEITEEESIDSENKEYEMTTYIAKIPEFNGEDIETSPQEWLDQVTKAGDANRWNIARMLRTIPYFLKETAEEWFENLATPFNDWNAFKAAFLEQFTDNNTSITLRNQPSESVMTYIGKFNKLLRRIHQLETNDYYSNAQILDQFIAGLKDKLIKKVRPHAPEDLNSVIKHAKRYEIAMEKANRTKLVNLAIGETSSAAEEKIDQLTKKVKNYFTNQQQQQPQRYQPPQRRNQNNFAPLSNNQPQNCHYWVINVTLHHSNLIINHHHQFTIHQDPTCPTTNPTAIPTTTHTTLSINNNRISLNNQLVPRNSTQPRPNHYHTQPTRIAENANLSDIFPFEFEANESPFLLSNAVANEQKAITAMYTEAEVEGKPICLILNSGSAGSIITYQLMQQLKRNTPVREIDNFPFILDGITIPVKVLVMDAPQYQALIGNNWLQKANANLNWETQELTISYQGQHAWVPAICGTFNKRSEKAPAFEFEPEEEKPIIETFMALGSMSN